MNDPETEDPLWKLAGEDEFFRQMTKPANEEYLRRSFKDRPLWLREDACKLFVDKWDLELGKQEERLLRSSPDYVNPFVQFNYSHFRVRRDHQVRGDIEVGIANGDIQVKKGCLELCSLMRWAKKKYDIVNALLTEGAQIDTGEDTSEGKRLCVLRDLIRLWPEIRDLAAEPAGGGNEQQRVTKLPNNLSQAEAAGPVSMVEQFPIRPNTSWDKITITFVSREGVHIRAPGFGHLYHFKDLGFANKKKSAKPIEAWSLLLTLANGEGEYTPTSPQEAARKAKQQGVINEKLCHFFRNDEPPVYLKQKTFHVRFSLHPSKR